MTIDEAIAKYKEITNTDANCPIHCMRSCDKCVQESGQLVEWLEELKVLRHGANELRNAGYEHGHSVGYNKAIDDLSNKICMHFADWQYSEEDKCIKDIIELASESVEEIAEQLKAGGNNEQNKM